MNHRHQTCCPLREKPAKGSDIITGSEAGKTNKFLQILAFAACAVKTSVKAEFVMGGQPLGGGGEEWEDVEVEGRRDGV